MTTFTSVSAFCTLNVHRNHFQQWQVGSFWQKCHHLVVTGGLSIRDAALQQSGKIMSLHYNNIITSLSDFCTFNMHGYHFRLGPWGEKAVSVCNGGLSKIGIAVTTD